VNYRLPGLEPDVFEAERFALTYSRSRAGIIMSNQSDSYVVKASAPVRAAPQRVYGIIADYRNGHPRILPKQFTSLTVEQGGIGDGTVIRFTMRIFGRRFAIRAVVTEQEPGRVLVEENVGDNPSTTTFTVDRGSTPEEALVMIATELPCKPGVLGALERFLTTRTLQSIYAQELKLLDVVARQPPVASSRLRLGNDLAP
jgi:hypothetical protein